VTPSSKALNTSTHRRASRLRLRVGSWERVAVHALGGWSP
jgi:hypothetical protein